MSPFEKLLAQLAIAEIKFITIGGLACVFNGYFRMTEDVDIVIENSNENIQNLITCMSSYGEGYAKELIVDDFSDEEGAIRISEDFPIDIFIRLGGYYYQDLLKYCKIAEVNGQNIPYLSVDGLILLKSASLRKKDIFDVINLRDLSDIG